MILKTLDKHMDTLRLAIEEAQRTMGAFETVKAYIAHHEGSNGHARGPKRQKLLAAPKAGSVEQGFWDSAILKALPFKGGVAAKDIWATLQKRHQLPDSKRDAFYQGLSQATRRGVIRKNARGYKPGPQTAKAKEQPVAKTKRKPGFPWKEAVTTVLQEKSPLASSEIWTAIAARYKNAKASDRRRLWIAVPYLRKDGTVVQQADGKYVLGKGQ